MATTVQVHNRSAVMVSFTAESLEHPAIYDRLPFGSFMFNISYR